MAYAVVQDVAATWEQYERVAAPMLEPAPEGLLLHVAGPTDEGFRTIDVWESEQAWQQFRAARLEPAIAALGGPARPQATIRDLRLTHVVFAAPPSATPSRRGGHTTGEEFTQRSGSQ